MEEIEREVAEGLCRCCMEKGLFDKKDNLLDSVAMGAENGTYLDMLLSCYAMNITFSGSMLKEKLICDLCIIRLKEAHEFRTLVGEAQKVWEIRSKTLSERVIVDDNCIIEEVISDDDWNGKFLEDKVEEQEIVEERPHEERTVKKKRIRKKKNIDPNKPKRNQYTTEKIFVKPTHNIKYSYQTNFDIIEEWYGSREVSDNKWKGFIRTKINLDKLQCLICNETFCQRIPLNNHLNVHFPVYTCDHCGKPFATKERLDYHNRGHDVGEYKCFKCGEVYYNLMRYKRHLQKHRPYYRSTCTLCPERFTTQYKQLLHMVEVHKTPPKPYKCSECDSSFLDPRKVRSHIRRVHLKERNHVCTACMLAYHTNYELKKHMFQSHGGEGLFLCSDCSESFTSEKGLKEHIKIHGKELAVVPMES